MGLLDFIPQTVDDFVGRLAPGLLPLPPMPQWIDGHAADLSQVPRDPKGIIWQDQRYQQPPAERPFDGGDSAMKTGIAAFSGSKQDQDQLGWFEQSEGIMVRHPTQFPWNNWKNSSRDQLGAFTAGCWRARRYDISKRLFEKHASRGFTCQNTEDNAPGTTKNPPIGDLMAPHDIMCLAIAGGYTHAYVDLAGQISLTMAIETFNTSNEINQLLCAAIMAGRLDMLVQNVPSWKDEIRNYWSGQPFRAQPQIAEEFIWTTEKELERYAGRPPIPDIIPKHVLAFFGEIDWGKEITNLDPGHRLEMAKRFAQAANDDAVAQAKKLGLPAPPPPVAAAGAAGLAGGAVGLVGGAAAGAVGAAVGVAGAVAGAAPVIASAAVAQAAASAVGLPPPPDPDPRHWHW